VSVPRHIAVILDGNRRWAKEHGTDTVTAYRRGGDRVHDLLSWCAELGIEVVTLWPLSTDNLARDPKEVCGLTGVIAAVIDELAAANRWRIYLVGDLSLLPREVAARVRAAQQRTQAVNGLLVNIAVAYDGHDEITAAVRRMLADHAGLGTPMATLAQTLTQQDIAANLFTAGQPDPDLIIRTSGEQRLSGFMPWQSTHAEFYFCPTHWPAFGKADLDNALSSYRMRQRRFGR
jgi:short-chain Z-isoprenyl diphosphate synthase